MKLEIGALSKKIDKDWKVLNCIKNEITDFICVWGDEKLPFEDNSIDLIYCSHVLEHIEWFKVDFALSEVFRVLKKGGEFECWVPNFEYLVQSYLKKECGDNWRKFNKNNNYMEWLNGRIFSYGPNKDNFHKCVFDESFLKEKLLKNGFTEISKLKKPRNEDHGKINLGLRGVK